MVGKLIVDADQPITTTTNVRFKMIKRFEQPFGIREYVAQV